MKTETLGESKTALFTLETLTCGSPARPRRAYVVRLGFSTTHPSTGHVCNGAYYGGCCIFVDELTNVFTSI